MKNSSVKNAVTQGLAGFAPLLALIPLLFLSACGPTPVETCVSAVVAARSGTDTSEQARLATIAYANISCLRAASGRTE
jgi:hypothetical protein